MFFNCGTCLGKVNKAIKRRRKTLLNQESDQFSAAEYEWVRQLKQKSTAKRNAKLESLSSTYDPVFAADYMERSDGSQWDAPPRDTEIFKEVGRLSPAGEANLWRDLGEAFDTARPDCAIAPLVDNAPSAVAFDTEYTGTGKTLTCFGWTNGEADGDHDDGSSICQPVS